MSGDRNGSGPGKGADAWEELPAQGPGRPAQGPAKRPARASAPRAPSLGHGTAAILAPTKVLPPNASLRQRLARDVFADENLDLLAHLLDDCFRLPGLPFRFGLDGLIGLVPVLGDVIAGLASSLIVIAAWFRGVPAVTLARMVVNVGIGVVVGMVPLLGDAFDVAWKANRRNYALLTRHLRQPNQHTWKDWAFLLVLGLALFMILAAPLLLLGWLIGWLMHAR